MPKFSVEHETKLSKPEAFKKLQEYLKHSEGLKKLDSSLTYTFDEKNFTGQLKGSKFECDVSLVGENPTKVKIDISIGLLLSPFKGKIAETLKGKMSQILG